MLSPRDPDEGPRIVPPGRTLEITAEGGEREPDPVAPSGRADMSPVHYVALSVILFVIGGVGVLVRRNAIVVFMCIELMLNACNLAFVAFARMHGNLDGQVIAFFVMVVAAAEVVVGLAILMAIFRARRSASWTTPACSSTELKGLRRDHRCGSGALKLSWLLLVFPLFGAVVLLLGGRRTDRWGHLLGVAMPVAAFVYGVIAFFSLLGDTNREQDQHLYTYIPVGRFQVDVSLLIDPLSICFVLLITGVGSLIIIYSVGYMAHDPDRRRFFGYMDLFLAAMLLLVLADNYLVLYVGWEGVGLASYLLIGFWQQRNSAAVAAKKAFVVNRVGDFGLTVAIFLMFAEFGSVSFTGVFHQVPSGGSGVATALGFLLLLGACGKSAQVPLQSWLLDAMEGPTPVSALIHAATMVTAGVYLLVRSNPILALSETRASGSPWSARSRCCSAASSPRPRTTSRSRWPVPP